MTVPSAHGTLRTTSASVRPRRPLGFSRLSGSAGARPSVSRMALSAAHAAATARIRVPMPPVPDSGTADHATQAAASRPTAPALRLVTGGSP